MKNIRKKCNGIRRKYWIEMYKQTLSNTHTYDFFRPEKKNEELQRFCCVSAYSISNINFIFLRFIATYVQHLVDKTHKIYLNSVYSCPLSLSVPVSCDTASSLSTHSAFEHLFLRFFLLFFWSDFEIAAEAFNERVKEIKTVKRQTSKLIRRKEFWMTSLYICFQLFLDRKHLSVDSIFFLNDGRTKNYSQNVQLCNSNCFHTISF